MVLDFGYLLRKGVGYARHCTPRRGRGTHPQLRSLELFGELPNMPLLRSVSKTVPTASLSSSVRYHSARARKGALWSRKMGPLTQPPAVGARHYDQDLPGALGHRVRLRRGKRRDRDGPLRGQEVGCLAPLRHAVPVGSRVPRRHAPGHQ
jgi:hypothetical protein